MREDHKLRMTRLAFYKQDVIVIDRLLQMFLRRSQSKCAILIDKEGHLITHAGEIQSYDMDTICTLLAGTFAATREWAKLLGEKEFSVLFHQGQKDNIQVSLVCDRALLAIIFDERTQLGLVRLMSAEVAKKLTEIFEQADNRKPEEQENEFISESFSEEAKGLLDQLFDQDNK